MVANGPDGEGGLEAHGGAVPKASICIPAYERPESLRRAVESVLAQTVPEVEVIVTDDSAAPQDLATEYGDPRLRYEWNPERLGMSANWQHGISLSRAPVAGLLMDDDVLSPRFVEQCLPRFADPRVGIVFTNHWFFDGARSRLRSIPLPGGTHHDFLAPLIREKAVNVSAALMRREIWRSVMPLPPMHTADFAVYIEVARDGWAFHYVDEPLMTYRTNGGNLSAEFAFRDHDVELWRRFEFEPGSEEERIRRRYLAEAMLGSAAARMRQGDFAAARQRGAEAAAVGAEELSRRARLTLLICRSGPAMRAVRLARPVSG